MPRAQGNRTHFLMTHTVGLKKKDVLKFVEDAASNADQKTANDTSIIGKEYFRNPEVNMGFYSRKRQGVADVDPKVSPRR